MTVECDKCPCGIAINRQTAYQLRGVEQFFCSNACARIFVNSNYGKTPGIASMARLKHYDFVSAYPVPGAQSLVPSAESVAPSAQNPSPPAEPRDLARMVFSTDPRVLGYARLRYECGGKGPDGGGPEEDIRRLRDAVSKLWDLGVAGHDPEVVWYREAVTLGERVGRPWHETPQPTLVEALAREMREPLWSLGFTGTAVPAGTSAGIEACPQVVFKALRFVLNDEAARVLLIEDMKMGNQSCMVSSSPMPASLFSASAFPMRLCMPTCNISQRIRFQFHNPSGSSVYVNAVLLGRVPEDKPIKTQRSSWRRSGR